MKFKNTVIGIAFIAILTIFMGCPGLIDFGDFTRGNDSGNSCSEMKPVVSAQWLESHKNIEGLLLLDIRSKAEYDSMHIEGSINVPFEMPISAWNTFGLGDLLMELPSIQELEATMSNNGISLDSKIIIITSVAEAPNPPYPLANATRVAVTLKYLGVENVSILDGGINLWIASGKNVVVEPTILPSTEFVANVNENIFVDADYVQTSIGSKVIVDARDSEVYLGEVVEPWANKAGHIPSAVSIPTVSVWNADGTYKTRGQLNTLVRNAIGNVSKDAEIIVYCGVGGYAGTMYYVLNSILGYSNVKFYDGSAQDWVVEHDMEL